MEDAPSNFSGLQVESVPFTFLENPLRSRAVDVGDVRVDIHAVLLCYSKPNKHKHCSQSQYSYL